jgi:hypothetical protein
VHKCAACSNVIAGPYHVFFGQRFHPQCLVCATCSRPLVPPSAVVCRGSFLCDGCSRCGQLMHCWACERPLLPTDKTIRPMGFPQTIHAACFSCFLCGARLAPNAGKLVTNAYVCDACDRQCSPCARCNRPIVGRERRAFHSVFHAEHFQCYVCDRPLYGDAFIIHHNHAYCPLDGQPFVKACTFCHRPFESLAKTLWRGKPYHQRCFVCHVCCEPIQGTPKQMHNRPHCEACFAQRSAEGKNRVHKPEEIAAARERIGQVLGKELLGPLYRQQPDEIELLKEKSDGDEESSASSSRHGSSSHGRSRSGSRRMTSRRRRSVRSGTTRGGSSKAGLGKRAHRSHHKHRSKHHAVGETKLHTIHHKDGTREEKKIIVSADYVKGKEAAIAQRKAAKPPPREEIEEVSTSSGST